MSLLGSCIGLGNIWRFPYLLASFGGGVFIIAFIIAILIIGVPLFALESMLGGKLRLSAVKIWETLKNNSFYRLVGWISISVLLIIAIYYSTIFGWTIRSFINAFNPSAWHFTNHIINFAPTKSVNTYSDLGKFQWDWLVIILVVWAITMFVIIKGVVGTIERINIFGIFLKIFLITVLFIYALTLRGAVYGLDALFQIKWSELKDIKLWSAAFSQVFFSSSLAVGIVFAFSRHAKKNQEVNLTASAIIFTNALVAIFIAILIYSMFGWYYIEVKDLPANEWKNISEFFNSPQFKDSLSGPGLLFNLIPTVLGRLNSEVTYLGSFIGICFFLAVILANFTCFIAIVVSISECVNETYKNLPKYVGLFVAFFPGIIITFFLCYKYSSALILAIDHYAENYFYLFSGLIEIFVFTWLVRKVKRYEFYNYANDVSGIKIPATLSDSLVKYVSFAAVSLVFVYGIVDDIVFKKGQNYFTQSYKTQLEFWISIAGGILFPLAQIFFLDVILNKINKKITPKNQRKVQFA